jgi:hypothetical protein
MANHAIRDDKGRITTILTTADIYEFKGFTFEVDHYGLPCKLKKNGEPAAAMGRRFWAIWIEWDKHTKEEKSATQISG